MRARELLEIYRDIDAYIRRGGKLIDVPYVVENKQWLENQVAVGNLTADTYDRIGRFFRLVVKIGEEKIKVADVLTEEQLQSLWRQTHPAN